MLVKGATGGMSNTAQPQVDPVVFLTPESLFTDMDLLTNPCMHK